MDERERARREIRILVLHRKLSLDVKESFRSSRSRNLNETWQFIIRLPRIFPREQKVYFFKRDVNSSVKKRSISDERADSLNATIDLGQHVCTLHDWFVRQVF